MKPHNIMKVTATVWGVYLVLVFPLFYFVYKFAEPFYIAHDFFHYYKLYESWDWQAVKPPFCMRVVSPFLVYLIGKTGISYETITAFDRYIEAGFEKRIFFTACFFNFVTVACCATVIFRTVLSTVQNRLAAFIWGAVYLLGFGTIFHHLMPLTEAFSTLLFAVLLLLYLQRSRAVFILLIISAFQREYILIAVCLIALADYFFRREKFYLFVLLLSSVLLVVYFFLRRDYFYNPELGNQTSFKSMAEGLLSPDIRVKRFLKQGLISMYPFFIYLILVAFKALKGLPVDRPAVIRMILLFLQLMALTFAVTLDTNAGRVFYTLVPLVILELAKESDYIFNVNSTKATVNP
jgi:hypothetical protein